MLISADSHVVEPSDLWTSRLPAYLQDRAPCARAGPGEPPLVRHRPRRLPRRRPDAVPRCRDDHRRGPGDPRGRPVGRGRRGRREDQSRCSGICGTTTPWSTSSTRRPASACCRWKTSSSKRRAAAPTTIGSSSSARGPRPPHRSCTAGHQRHGEHRRGAQAHAGGGAARRHHLERTASGRFVLRRRLRAALGSRRRGTHADLVAHSRWPQAQHEHQTVQPEPRRHLLRRIRDPTGDPPVGV